MGILPLHNEVKAYLKGQSTKGLKISKNIYDVLDSSKKRKKRSIFGRIQDAIICFLDLLSRLICTLRCTWVIYGIRHETGEDNNVGGNDEWKCLEDTDGPFLPNSLDTIAPTSVRDKPGLPDESEVVIKRSYVAQTMNSGKPSAHLGTGSRRGGLTFGELQDEIRRRPVQKFRRQNIISKKHLRFSRAWHPFFFLFTLWNPAFS